MEGLVGTANAVSRVLLRGDDPGSILEGVCEALTAHGSFSSAYAFLSENGSAPTEVSVHPPDSDLRSRLLAGEYPEVAVTALASSGTVFKDGWLGCRFESAGHGFGGLFAVPAGMPDSRPVIDSLFRGITEDLAFAVTRLRQALRHDETGKLLAAVYQSAPVIMFLIDHERRVLQVNGTACDFAARPGSEMTGLRCGDALRCLYSLEDPRGCGQGPFCPDCRLRLAIAGTLETGRSHRQEEVTLPFRAGAERRDFTLLFSTTRLGLRGRPVVLVTMQDITERKEAENRLFEAHTRLNTIMDITNTRLDVIDEDFNLVYVDPGWVRVFGEPEGKKCYDYFMAGEGPCVTCAIPAALETGEPQIAEQVIRREGDRFVEVHTIPFRDSRGKRLLAEFNIDITRRKRIEEELRNRESYLRSIFRTAPVGIGTVREGIIEDVNPFLCAMTGYSRDELVGKEAGLLESPEDPSGIPGAPVWARPAEEEGGMIETRFITSSGEVLDILLSSTLLDPEDPSKGNTFTALDISESRRSSEALKESEAYFRAIFQSINDGVFVDDADTMEIIDVNDTVTRMYGYSRDEVIRRRIAGMSSGSPPYDQAGAVTRLEKARREGPQVFEWLAKHRSGRTFWVEVNARYAEIAGRKRFIVTVRDITDRKAAEEERRRLERKMHRAQKLESLGVLAGGIAHDFNNIMMIVLGNAQLASSSLPEGSPAAGSLADIETAAHRASELCRQILAYSGKSPLSMQSVDPGELVKEMTGLLRASIPKQIRLDLTVPPGLPEIVGDPASLRQVFMNLIINASEAMDETPGTIQVTLGSDRYDSGELAEFMFSEPPASGEFVSLEVSDTGCGIAPGALDVIFEPFYTTKSAGRGLGLAAVQGILGSHGGGIRVTTEPGKGTSVKVLLPRPETTPEPPAPSGEDQVSREWRGRGSLLLVDDEESLRNLGTRMLEHLGFSVETARDGIEAVEVYRENPGRFRGVLMDLSMPRMDGIQAYRELIRTDPELKAVLISGYRGEDAAAGLPGGGFSGFLQKPYTLEKLRSLLCEVFP